jgi:hypothetical protein
MQRSIQIEKKLNIKSESPNAQLANTMTPIVAL